MADVRYACSVGCPGYELNNMSTESVIPFEYEYTASGAYAVH